MTKLKILLPILILLSCSDTEDPKPSDGHDTPPDVRGIWLQSSVRIVLTDNFQMRGQDCIQAQTSPRLEIELPYVEMEFMDDMRMRYIEYCPDHRSTFRSYSSHSDDTGNYVSLDDGTYLEILKDPRGIALVRHDTRLLREVYTTYLKQQ